MHANRLPTNIDRDEARRLPRLSVDVIDLDRCIPAALPDSSHQPNQPKYEDGHENAFGFDAVSGLVQPTPADGPAQQGCSPKPRSVHIARSHESSSSASNTSPCCDDRWKLRRQAGARVG